MPLNGNVWLRFWVEGPNTLAASFLSFLSFTATHCIRSVKIENHAWCVSDREWDEGGVNEEDEEQREFHPWDQSLKSLLVFSLLFFGMLSLLSLFLSLSCLSHRVLCLFSTVFSRSSKSNLKLPSVCVSNEEQAILKHRIQQASIPLMYSLLWSLQPFSLFLRTETEGAKERNCKSSV